MVTAMGIEKDVDFYRAYQPDERSLVPVAVMLATGVALWGAVYFWCVLSPYADAAVFHMKAQPSYLLTEPVRR